MNLGQLIGAYILAGAAPASVLMGRAQKRPTPSATGRANHTRAVRHGLPLGVMRFAARQRSPFALGTVARHLGVNTPRISSHVLSLTRGGLLARTGERWFYRYEITDAGRAALEEQQESNGAAPTHALERRG